MPAGPSFALDQRASPPRFEKQSRASSKNAPKRRWLKQPPLRPKPAAFEPGAQSNSAEPSQIGARLCANQTGGTCPCRTAKRKQNAKVGAQAFAKPSPTGMQGRDYAAQASKRGPPSPNSQEGESFAQRIVATQAERQARRRNSERLNPGEASPGTELCGSNQRQSGAKRPKRSITKLSPPKHQSKGIISGGEEC